MYKFEFRNGNYFWDPQNGILVEYGSETKPGLVGHLSVAFPIPITDDILELLGFHKESGNFVYKNNKETTIVVDGASHKGFYTSDGEAVVFLNDLQNAFADKNLNLDLDVETIVDFLKKVWK